MPENSAGMGDVVGLNHPSAERPPEVTTAAVTSASDGTQQDSEEADGEVDYLMVFFVLFLMLINTNILQCLHCLFRRCRRKCLGEAARDRFVKTLDSLY